MGLNTEGALVSLAQDDNGRPSREWGEHDRIYRECQARSMSTRVEFPNNTFMDIIPTLPP